MSYNDLECLRNKIREYCQLVGQKQKNLAAELGYSSSSFCHKLNGTNNAILTRNDVKGIILKLAEWEAFNSQAEVMELVELLKLPNTTFSAQEWNKPPLKSLQRNISHFPTMEMWESDNHQPPTFKTLSSVAPCLNEAGSVTLTVNLNAAIAIANLIRVFDTDFSQYLENAIHAASGTPRPLPTLPVQEAV